MRRVFTAQNSTELERLQPLWDYLCSQSPSATVFQSFALNQLIAQKLTECPYVVAAETENGAAIIPAAISDGNLTLLGDCLFDYRDLLAQGDHEAIALAWQRLAGLELPFRVSGLRSGANFRIWQALGAGRWSAAPCVPRERTSVEQFSSAHSRLGSRVRRLQRAGVEMEQFSGSNSHLVRWIYEKKARQFELNQTGMNIFGDTRRIEFMVAWCAVSRTDCEIFCFKSAGEIVSALVTFRDAGFRRFYTVCFDPQWEKFSPGTALVYEIARRTLGEELDADFMTGEQPHKLRMATATVALYSVSAQPHALLSLADQLWESAQAAA